MRLAQWQAELIDAVIGGSDPSNLVQACTSSETPGLEVYRNNRRQSLIKALERQFPICQAIVGEDFFKELCRHYIAWQPLEACNLNDYGRHFSEFVTGYYRAFGLSSDYDYLLDLLVLEFFLHSCYYAEDAQLFDLSTYSALSEQQQPHSVFHLAPDVFLFHSEYPLFEIWRKHQQGLGSIDIEFPSCRYYFCIYRKNYRPCVERLESKSFQLLQYMSAGLSLAELAEIPELESVLNVIPGYIQCGWINGFHYECEAE